MKTVLTVDDSKVVRSMVARCLESYGCRIVEATNGQEGVAAARQHKPDLILLDITMPVMDGRQALAELRKDVACAAIPVIMLTAESGRDIVLEIARMGVTGYIVKPFQKETFDTEVGKVLGAAESNAPIDRGAVLVVNDSERVLEAARAALESSVKLLTANGGKAAVERYREARPGVVVIDLSMPEMDGFETLAQLKPLGPSCYIALAVRGDDAQKEKARRAGYQAVLEKPFQPQQLLEQVKAAMESGGSAEETVRSLLADEAGCSVLCLPEPGSKLFGRLVKTLAKTMRSLAEDGSDKLIVDLGQVADVNAEVASLLAHLITEARTMGIRMAICAPSEQTANRLRDIAETRDMPYATTRDAARRSLLAGS
jgi:two-component system, cell cycle response regulator